MANKKKHDASSLKHPTKGTNSFGLPIDLANLMNVILPDAPASLLSTLSRVLDIINRCNEILKQLIAAGDFVVIFSW